MKKQKNTKMVKQSSIEWLIECLNIHLTEEQKTQFEGLFQQSKQMHKEEVTDAYWDGGQDIPSHISTCENYYTQTYGGDNGE